MADEKPNENQKLKWRWYIIRNKFIARWNKTIGKRVPMAMLTPITREGKPQEVIGVQLYDPLYRLNDGKVAAVGEIESKWRVIEKFLFGDNKFEKEPRGGNVSDFYRKIEYFRDNKLALKEATIFKEFGTVDVSTRSVPIDVADFIRKAERHKAEYERRIAELEAKQSAGTINENELKELEDKRYMLARTEEFLANPSAFIDRVRVLPSIDIRDAVTSFTDGREEKIVAIGTHNMDKITKLFTSLHEAVDTFASSAGIPPFVRNPIGDMLKQIREELDKVNKLEVQHGEKVTDIVSILVELHEKITLKTGITEEKRTTKDWTRFAHTYKIIKPYRIAERRVGGSVVSEFIKFKDEHPNFKRAYEVEPGLDENGWPLEVYEEPEGSGNWFVLLDKWWVEISENTWQENTIKRKSGGLEVWRDKVINGVKRTLSGHILESGRRRAITYTHGYRTGYIRKVPAEYVGDMDPLDKISFISNETDAFRDDFRDGRVHSHSKSSMDYIIASADNIIPEEPINFPIETLDPEVRIRFRPIYYTEADFGTGNLTDEQNKLLGTVNPRGGMGRIREENIPNDERQVSRRYTMETEFGKRENKVRKPTHLDPAFDRAAITHTFIHWGRMYYYETTSGINRWSENPFPHVTTRGFAKYLINLTLMKSFKYSEARNALKGHKWDYGVRHYGEPFTEDPLGPAEGPGGALAHAIEVAKRPQEEE